MRSPLLAIASSLCLAAAVPAQLAGTYAVGPGGNYANLAAAIADLAAVGVAAPVTFLVTANDTGPWTIPAFTGQGPANPVLFDALGPITLGGAQPLLTLNDCASVTFRGVSGDVSLFAPGAGGSAAFAMTIPNQAGFVGLVFFTQALVLDPPANALGAITSSAAIVVVGP